MWKLILKVIETNITYNGYGKEIHDFQSRVIEVDDWESYVKEIKQCKSVTRSSYLGNMYGESFPRYYQDIDLFKSNDYQIRVDFYNGTGKRMTKLAYLVR